jgi:hypothetical protein
MTIGVCCALTFALPAPLDARFPIALAYAYTLMRPFYILGYIADPMSGRLPAVLLGGF